jgi:protease PrsW
MTPGQPAGTTDGEPRARRTWWRVLLIGGILYALGLVVLGLTLNPNVFPTVVLLGNFLVPVTYVAFFYDHRQLSPLTLPTTALSFFYGGVLGVFAAALLEPLFIRRLDLGAALGVGLIEEFAKILGVLVIARHRRHDAELDGLILGAAAGMGFAALESNGYAFTAFLQSGGSLSVTVVVTLLRGVLAPIGHGTWTAILASVLFRDSATGRFHLTRKVLGTYLTVAVLHGLWDGLPGALLALNAPGNGVLIGELLVGGIGFVILWRRWREAVRRQRAQAGE